ncbi:Patatin/Phospholipase A2-related [Kalmanozyma brasiliensis GHG001]|uniref:Triacylglycerol lipase n=1 Tax=Kalmanozyma brasiliensis (strain GHG001) TaxID=1365824 RepID=V5GK75_KALBG|nr:Patatin/Phospholipase A2-related [Kalmanozyma brasiliensis GHG001]EST06372.1 Patatin/Phospholipase A2-related [Kalmanozyma brasiliensis GHG001]
MTSLFRRRQQPSPAALSTKGNPVESAVASSSSTPPGTLTPSQDSRSRSRSQPTSGPSSDKSNVKTMGKRRRSLGNLLSPSLFPRTPEEELDPLLTAEYVIPEHIEAFREALATDLGQQEYQPSSSSQITGSSSWNVFGYTDAAKSPTENGEGGAAAGPIASLMEPKSPHMARPSGTQVSNPRKVGRIAAASDFAPIHEKVSRKGKKTSIVDSGTREGFIFHTLRYPLLLIIFLIIGLEFLLYVIVRQLVNVIEYTIAWRGTKGQLRKRMRSADNHTEWKEAALAQDEFLGYERWKTEDGSGFYDWILVKKVKSSLKSFREKDDAENLLGVLDLCLRNNFAGTENFRLYSETYFGSKYLVESYLAEIETSLAYIQSTDKVSLETKRSFYRTVSKNLGRSALCLSGGASFGYYHIGVVRALLDSNLLPKVVTGTSAGGLIAALTCTRTDAELRQMLVPALADRITACEEPFSVWGRRAWSTGARFDTVKWAEKASFFTMGSMTFKEAYERTGKVLCISVIPADRHSPVKLLNYITAPDCVIWSSLLASAAVPGILNPVCLMQKRKGSREIVPWNWGHRFKDGSLRVDIPLQDLHALFNVNYPIVSQVNPHVHLFHFGSKGSPGRPTAHRKGKGWRGGFILSASERILKLNLAMNFKILRDLDLLPAILGQDWSSVFLQRFGGAVTIWPKTRFWDWVRILSDPDRKELTRMMRVGQGVTFPKVHMIENRIRLERAIEEGRKACRRASRATSGGKERSPVNPLQSLDRASRTSGESMTRPRVGPQSATSLPSDTDNDDFFSSKEVAAFTKVAGAVLRNGDSAVGTPNSVGQMEEPPSPKSGASRPKPYPTYSRYLIDSQGSTSRAADHPEEQSGRAVREWLDRSQGDPEDAVDLEDEEGGSQMPFMSAAAQSEGVRRNGNGRDARGRMHRPSFGSSPVQHRLRQWHGKSRHSWDDRGQEFEEDEDEVPEAEADDDRGIYESSSADESDPADRAQ